MFLDLIQLIMSMVSMVLLVLSNLFVVMQILFGGLWSDGSGYTAGEEDELVFSYLSRIGSTTKYMLPEGKRLFLNSSTQHWEKESL